DPHALAAGLILQVEDPEHGPMRQMGNVAWLDGDVEATRKTAATAFDPPSRSVPCTATGRRKAPAAAGSMVCLCST
ncbi:MAG: hypothetical protein AAGJ28_16405, partial [Pseudomonadota bacterium]